MSTGGNGRQPGAATAVAVTVAVSRLGPVRAWIDLGDAGWADVRYAIAAARRLGYVTEEVRGTGRVWLRLAGGRLDVSDLWIMPSS